MGNERYMILTKKRSPHTETVYGMQKLSAHKYELYRLQEEQKERFGKEFRTLYCLCNCHNGNSLFYKIPLTISKPRQTDKSIRITNSRTEFALQHSVFCRYNPLSRLNGPLYYSETAKKYCCNLVTRSRQNERNVICRLLDNSGKETYISDRLTFREYIEIMNRSFFIQFWKEHAEKHVRIHMDDFNRSIYGKIVNMVITSGKNISISESDDHFFYALLDKLYFHKENDFVSISLLPTAGKTRTLSIHKKLIQTALNEFEQEYGISVEQCLRLSCVNIIVSGLSYYKDGARFPRYKELHFFLADSYGLFCRSISHAQISSYVIENILKRKREKDYIYYHPYMPSLMYAGHKDYICDGILLNQHTGREIIFEVFDGSFSDSHKIQKDKETLIGHSHFFWDVFRENSFPEKKLSNFLSSILQDTWRGKNDNNN